MIKRYCDVCKREVHEEESRPIRLQVEKSTYFLDDVCHACVPPHFSPPAIVEFLVQMIKNLHTSPPPEAGAIKCPQCGMQESNGVSTFCHCLNCEEEWQA